MQKIISLASKRRAIIWTRLACREISWELLIKDILLIGKWMGVTHKLHCWYLIWCLLSASSYFCAFPFNDCFFFLHWHSVLTATPQALWQELCLISNLKADISPLSTIPPCDICDEVLLNVYTTDSRTPPLTPPWVSLIWLTHFRRRIRVFGREIILSGGQTHGTSKEEEVGKILQEKHGQWGSRQPHGLLHRACEPSFVAIVIIWNSTTSRWASTWELIWTHLSTSTPTAGRQTRFPSR